MKGLVPLTFCLALFVAAGCGRSTPPSDDGTQSKPGAEASAEAPSAPAEEAKPPEPRPIEITDEMVAAYLAYGKERLVIVQQYVAEGRKRLEAAKSDVGKLAEQVALSDKMRKELDAKLKAARAAAGLGEQAFEVLEDAAQMVATGRSLYNQMGGDAQLARMEAEQKARIATLPADQRPAAEAELADMTKSFGEVRDGLEVRKKYGDRSAEVLLRHADELAKQFEAGLRAMGDAK